MKQLSCFTPFIPYSCDQRTRFSKRNLFRRFRWCMLLKMCCVLLSTYRKILIRIWNLVLRAEVLLSVVHAFPKVVQDIKRIISVLRSFNCVTVGEPWPVQRPNNIFTLAQHWALVGHRPSTVQHFAYFHKHSWPLMTHRFALHRDTVAINLTSRVERPGQPLGW
jgi:hypothetical protein